MAANNNWNNLPENAPANNNWNNLPGNALVNYQVANNAPIDSNMQMNAAPSSRGIFSRVVNYFRGSPQERLWYALITVYELPAPFDITNPIHQMPPEVRQAISVISDPEVKPFLNKPANPNKILSTGQMKYKWQWGTVEPLLIGLTCQGAYPQLLHALIEHGVHIDRPIRITVPIGSSRESMMYKKEFPIFLIDSIPTIVLAFQRIPAPSRYQMTSKITNDPFLIHIAKNIMTRYTPSLTDQIRLKSLFDDVFAHHPSDLKGYPFMLIWVSFSKAVRDKTILLQVLTLLHQAGADPNMPDPNSNGTAIMYASTPEVYDWFIAHGANPMAMSKENMMNVMINAMKYVKDPVLIGHILKRSPETVELLIKPSRSGRNLSIPLSDMINITTRHDLIDFISTIIETIGPNHGHVMTELIIILFSDPDLLVHDHTIKIDQDTEPVINLTDAVRVGKIKELDWKRLRAQALGALADRENVSMIEGTCFYPHQHDLETGCISEDSINVYVESKYPEISDADKLQGIPCMVPSCPKKLLSSELSAMMGDRVKWKQLRPRDPNKVTVLDGLNQTISIHDAILFDKPVQDPKGFGMIHLIGMCPFCLEPVTREEGCIYMTHANTHRAPFYHSPFCNPSRLIQSLHNEYNAIAKQSLSANNLAIGITPSLKFCIECGGPAVSHQHFTVEHPIRAIQSTNYGICPLGGRRHLLARVLAVRDVYRNRPAALEDPMVERERAARAAQAAIQDPAYLARADAIMEKMKAYQEAETAFNQNKSNARKQAKNAAEKALVWNYPLPTGVTYNHPNYKARNEELKRAEEEKKEPSQNVALASMAKNNEMSSSSSSSSSSGRMKASRKSNSNNNNNNRGKRYKTMHKRNNRNNQNNQGNQNAMNGGRHRRLKRTRRNRRVKTT